MPRGSSPKREKEYKEILSGMKKRGEYKGRQKEVAARIVNKQRRKAGETKGSKASRSRSSSSKSRSTRSSSSKSRSSSKRK